MPQKPTLILTAFLAFSLFSPLNLKAQEPISGINRVVRQIDSQFPLAEGYVITLVDDELILDLKLGQSVKQGDRLKLIRYGKKLKHPVSGKDLGRLETDLGEVKVLEVRKNFTRARVTDPLIKVKKGDGVRSYFKKLIILTGPVTVQTPQTIDTNALLGALEKELNTHPRFETPALDLGVWLLESELEAKDLSRPEILKHLRQKTQADYILHPEVRSIKGKLILSYRLTSVRDGTLVRQGQVLSGVLPKMAKPFSPVQNHKQEFRGQEIKTPFERKQNSIDFVGKQQFDYEIVDFDIGDINGDGRAEYVVASLNRLYIYNYENDRFKQIAQISRTRNINRFIAVDVGDINGNRKDEIFVTNQYLDQLGSFVLELQGKKMNPVWQNINAYFRIIRPFNSQPVLLYQSLGYGGPFDGEIRTIQYRNGKYQKTSPLEIRDKDLRSRQFILYGLNRGNVDADKNIETIILDKDYHLRVYSASGKLLIKSDEYYGHDPRPMRVGLKEKWVDMASQASLQDPIYFRGRLLLEQQGRRKFLIVPRNHRFGGTLLARTIVINNCSLVILNIGKEGFEKVFETKKQKGYLAAYQIEGASGGRKIHMATVNKGSFGQKTTSSILTYVWAL